MNLILLMAAWSSVPAEAKKPKKSELGAPMVTAPVAAPVPAAPPAPPRIEKQPIGECGCSVYAPAGLTVEPPTKSPDGSDVWTAYVASGEHELGVIAVKLSFDASGSDEEIEALLVSYLDYLKGNFGITSAVGYGRGHRLESNPAARGVIDFWRDGEGDEWAVKAWLDGHKIGVLYVAGPGSYPFTSVQTLFLDGFRFE
jgi:hypothetical protein